jgi:cytoskeletal protein RodZ
MSFEGFVAAVPGGPVAVVAATVVGLLGIVFILFCALKGNGGRETTPRRPLASVSESEGEENSGEDRPKHQHSRSKFKQQPSAKKVTLPPHPLLAAEFKGHTGAVLSLDFDSNGKYLASCSDGE